MDLPFIAENSHVKAPKASWLTAPAATLLMAGKGIIAPMAQMTNQVSSQWYCSHWCTLKITYAQHFHRGQSHITVSKIFLISYAFVPFQGGWQSNSNLKALKTSLRLWYPNPCMNQTNILNGILWSFKNIDVSSAEIFLSTSIFSYKMLIITYSDGIQILSSLFM